MLNALAVVDSIVDSVETEVRFVELGELANVVTTFPTRRSQRQASFIMQHFSVANLNAYSEWNRELSTRLPHQWEDVLTEAEDVTPNTELAIRMLNDVTINTMKVDGTPALPPHVDRAFDWVRNTFRHAVGSAAHLLAGSYVYGLPELATVVATTPQRHLDDVAFLLRGFSDATAIESVLMDHSVPRLVGYSKHELLKEVCHVPPDLDAAEFTLGLIELTVVQDGTDEGFDGRNVVKLIRMLRSAA